MTIGELTKYLEDWAPPGVSWDRDNVGLQIGSRRKRLKNIMLCLELNQEALSEALKKKCNFIFTHHPLIFNPIKKLDTQNDSQAKLLETIIKKDITVYSAHTNLDFTKDGVSFELAKVLKLKNIRFLEPAENTLLKIAVFIPKNILDKVAEAVFSAGSGIIGEYTKCSFSNDGVGTFFGSEKSNPLVGKKLNFEKVDETRLEFIVDSWNLRKVISAIKSSHPYEEPAYDIYPLKNENVNYGAGAVGELEKALSENEFLDRTRKYLKTNLLRYTNGKKNKIKKVAVCGGSGIDLLNKAINTGADAFITADIKYHSFQDAYKKILLIDAGHYETEIPVLNVVKSKIEKQIPKKDRIKVFKYSGTTNPVKVL